MKRLLIVLATILVIGALLLGSCSKSTTTTTTAPKPTTTAPKPTTTTPLPPIKVGHLVNLTGPEAMVGGMQKTSLEAAFDAIGNQIAGRQIQIIVGDAGGEPADAVDAARKMVENDKVVALFGPTEIGQKMAVAGYCKQAGIPLIIYNPSPLMIFDDNNWVIGSGGGTPQCPSCMGDYLFNHLGYKTIVTITEDNSARRSFMDPLTQIFTADGGTVVQQQWVAEENTDFAPYLAALKDADALVAWETGDTAIKFLTQYHQLGIDKKMPVIGAFHGGFLDPFVPLGMDPSDAAAVVGALAPMGWAPDSQDAANQDFLKVLTPMVDFPPGDDASSGPGQAAMLFTAAVKATSGDTTPDKLIAALHTVSIVGPEGPESIGVGQGAATKNIYILRVDKVPGVDAYHYTTVFTYKDVPPTGYTGKP